MEALFLESSIWVVVLLSLSIGLSIELLLLYSLVEETRPYIILFIWPVLFNAAYYALLISVRAGLFTPTTPELFTILSRWRSLLILFGATAITTHTLWTYRKQILSQ